MEWSDDWRDKLYLWLMQIPNFRQKLVCANGVGARAFAWGEADGAILGLPDQSDFPIIVT